MEELNLKIDNLIDILNKDERIIKIEKLKNKITSNKELLNKIEKLKELDKYSDEYISLKKELFNDKDFVSFKELENEIDFLILEINNHIKKLTNERSCVN